MVFPKTQLAQVKKKFAGSFIVVEKTVDGNDIHAQLTEKSAGREDDFPISVWQSLVPHLGLTPHRISLRHVLGFCDIPSFFNRKPQSLLHQSRLTSRGE